MKLNIENVAVLILDNEDQVLQEAANQVQKLPPHSVIALWPDSIGRQMLKLISLNQKTQLTIYTLGSFGSRFNIVEYLKPIVNNPNVKIIQHLPNSPIQLCFLIPRPTMLSIALLNSAQNIKQNIKQFTTQQLIDEIGGCYGYERQGAQSRSDCEMSSESEYEYGQNRQFSMVDIDSLCTICQKIVFIFKGDLYKETCTNVIQDKVGQAGNLFKYNQDRCSIICDILSSAGLKQIERPWTQSQFSWTHQTAKMALCQTSIKTGKKIFEIQLDDLSFFQVYMSQQQLDFYKDYTINDISQRMTTITSCILPNQALKVIMFSPHPDDDAISAGAMLRSLAQQQRIELHIAYCVSGAVAVPDDFVLDQINRFCIDLQLDQESDGSLGDQITYCKNPQQAEIQQLQYITLDNISNEQAIQRFKTGLTPKSKGYLREIEAMSALDSINFFENVQNQAHFLRMPFYGSGFGRRDTPGLADVNRVIKLLQFVQPQIIFLAGDLSDPHGTHGFCYSVIKDALNIFEESRIKQLTQMEKNSLYSIYNTQQIKKQITPTEILQVVQSQKLIYKFMYRGAWSEFNVEDATYIMHFQDAELTQKLKTIRFHQSQMGKALYLGGDDRAFDIRAQERNADTMTKLKILGFGDLNDKGAECYVGCGILP